MNCITSSCFESQNYKEFGKAQNLDRRSAIFNNIIAVTDELMRQTPFTLIFHDVRYKYHLYCGRNYFVNRVHLFISTNILSHSSNLQFYWHVIGRLVTKC